MANIKFTQLPDQGAPTDATIIPSVASGTNYTVTGANLKAYVNSTTGNVSGGNILTTGLISAAGNVRGGNINTAGVVSATGNISGNYIVGNGSLLSNLTGANVTGNVANATHAFTSDVANTAYYATTATSANTATTAGTVTTAAQPTITSLGTLTSINTSGAISATGNITAGNVTALGNISAGYLLGNGSALTGIVANTTYNNSNVAAFLPTYTGNLNPGNISATGNITAAGNITGAYVKGNGSALTGTVTSIVAGSGISINVSTGAVTVTATGGGGSGSSISTGNAFVDTNATSLGGGNIVWMYNGTKSGPSNFAWAGNSTIIQNTQGNAYSSIQLSYDGNISMGGTLADGTTSSTVNLGTYAKVAGQLLVNYGGGNLQTTINSSGITTPVVTSPAISASATLQIPFATKTNSSPGAGGQLASDSNYLYVCTGTNTWKRIALTAF